MTLEQAHEQLKIAGVECEKGNFFNAEQVVRETLRATHSIMMSDNSELIQFHARANRILGTVALCLGDYPTALKYMEESLEQYEISKGKQNLSSLLGNMGIIFESLSDYPKALEYYQRALALDEEYNNIDGIITGLSNIGLVYLHLFNYQSALDYFEKAYQNAYKINSKEGMGFNLSNIGTIYQYRTEYTLALDFYEKSNSCYEELTPDNSTVRNFGLARNLCKIGTLYAEEAYIGYNNSKAEEFYIQAKNIYEELGLKNHLYDIHKYLSELYKNQKRWEEFAYHIEKYYELEKIFQSEETKKLADRLYNERKIAEREKELAVERARYEATQELLHNVLPPSITKRLLDKEKPIADKAESVSVFFSDIVGFTLLSQKVSAKELVSGLNNLFTIFDALAKKHGLEKIKTIGDAYMAVSGVPESCENHTEKTIEFALAICELFNQGMEISGHRIEIRIGLHCGEVIAGVIGENKFAYDLWGDAVNTAARMESHGEAGKIHCSEEFKNALTEAHGRASQLNNVQFISRGEMEIKGKGMMKTFFLERA